MKSEWDLGLTLRAVQIVNVYPSISGLRERMLKILGSEVVLSPKP